ncbi:MAG: hypothetical protein KVP17_004016 [Porospora cf. gigantea B]|uniref:uncharacterized protein n=2 Tax=Porospora cf. gigantea B TaxID=2853592 RepID=UPI003571C6A7|nr:MAG: hypothetical protein KVP17_004016 [Porospora cf. gigantea B]
MAAQPHDHDHRFKIVLVGDTSVGKSCLLLRFSDDEFTDSYITTIGVDFRFRTIQIDDKIVKLQIWDTAGQERFRTITSAYYRGANGVIVVCDVTNPKSVESVDGWMAEIQKYTSEYVTLMLVGNKTDDENRNVTEEEVKAKAAAHAVPYVLTSAKTAENVEEAFVRLARRIIERTDESSAMPAAAIGLDDRDESASYSCCS